ncbi:unnamed protein product [Periconia digitata]|uniref:Uncharacterized protein n=1 Tax=Periconia digitata TaxID=1303443 RepID=A0A9W4XY94_9PLEO|nr:unnamed protein product [Periconia digitata]
MSSVKPSVLEQPPKPCVMVIWGTNRHARPYAHCNFRRPVFRERSKKAECELRLRGKPDTVPSYSNESPCGRTVQSGLDCSSSLFLAETQAVVGFSHLACYVKAQ